MENREGVLIAERLLPRLRNTEHAPRSFLFSPLPHFAFISCAHQTIFQKKKKTYGNVLCGMRWRRGASDRINRVFDPKMNKLMALETDDVTMETCEKTNLHGQNLIFKQFYGIANLCARKGLP